MKVKSLVICCGLILSPTVFSALPGVNAPAINPGAALEDKIRQEKRLQRKKNQNDEAKKHEQDGEIKASEDAPKGASFTLQRVNFSKSEHLNREDLIQVVEAYVGKDVSFGDLKKMVAKINILYRKKGVYTATAVLPQQQIENGIVYVRLIEGTLGALKIEGNDYTEDAAIRSWVQPGGLSSSLDAREIENDILIYNRVNQQQLQAELKAGDSFGLTDIVVQVNEPSRDVLQLFADNQGYISSGQEEVGAMYQRQQLFLAGDRSLAYMLFSEGMQSLSLGYNAPLGTSRWRMGGTTSYTSTEVIAASDFGDFDIHGESIRVSFDASHLSFSTPSMWFNTLLSINATQSTSEGNGKDGVTVDISKYNFYQLTAGGEYIWMGPSWQLSSRANISLNRNDDKLDLDDNTSNNLFNADVTGIYHLPWNMYVLQHVEGQYSHTQGLRGIETITIGGPSTIRGYEAGALSGDSGWYQQLELHYNGLNLSYLSMDVFGFYDAGKVRLQGADKKAAAAGIGVGLSDNNWFRLDMTAAKALKDNVIPNQDDWTVFARITCTCIN
ncbi:MAG: ShlB/FhaC/HecB family hemolysin secretion/activation protein [Pseudomonadales bacterium]|nr:ShlB/FhaC/HecB family hemolysin secretion/activation protein [Pseudomonadales bacterium]